MPAINVAKTDTFEIQRQKINEIGSRLFDVTGGGSDLSTGKLKLGDGSITEPSLAFDNDATLGVYKPSNFRMGFVSNSKKVFDFSDRELSSFKNLNITRTSVKSGSITTLSAGSGYEGTKTFTNVDLIGGTGNGAQATIVVDKFVGSLTDIGSGYTNGTFANALLVDSLNESTRTITATATISIVEGNIVNIEITDHGTGSPSVNDILIVKSVFTVSGVNIVSGETLITGFTSVTDIQAGDSILQTGGTGSIDPNAVVVDKNVTNNTVTIDIPATTSGSLDLEFIPPYGDATTDAEFTISSLGSVSDLTVTSGGSGYIVNDELSVNPEDLIAPIDYTVTVNEVTEFTLSTTVAATNFPVGSQADFGTGGFGGEGNVYEIVGVAEDSSGNAVRVLVGGDATADDGGSFRVDGAGTSYTVTAAETADRFFLQTGTGSPVYAPDLTLYVGSTYSFSYPADHPFAFSKFPDGPYTPSFIEDRRGTLDINSNDVVLNNVTGIVAGMIATISEASGFGAIESEGSLLSDTFVTSVNVGTNTVTLSKPPLSGGFSALDFKGVEYTTRVSRSSNMVMITIASDTPTLYYYCQNHENMAGIDGTEAVITIDPNNPVSLGSGFLIRLAEVDDTDVITNDVLTGEFFATSIESGSSLLSDTITANTSLSSPLINGNQISLTEINANTSNTIAINSGSTSISGDISVGSLFTITSATGNLQSGGQVKSSTFNSGDKLLITNNSISTTAGNALLLSPADQEVTKVNSTTAFVIPSGTSEERPTGDKLENGAIRFNESTQQYEGYSEDSSSWSSLGGVRDVDGNTYIIAEETIGANDNNIWFFNDDINTLKLGSNHLSFQNIKKIRSQNVSAQQYTEWISNQPVTAGQFLKSGYNIYEVIISGTTGTSGNTPNDISGNDFINGSATLRWVNTAVDTLTLTEISDIKVTKGTSVTFDDDLRFASNKISSLQRDILIEPLDGQKVEIKGTTSLVIPVGDNSNKGAPAQGSIRYNTSDKTFEGFNGNQWGSLGGVKDVDGNTYIIPETAPGENENILYFYNNDSNTLRVTTSAVEFDAIDTVTSSSDEFELTASLLTIDSASLTIDNTASDTTFLHSAKEYFNIGISSGLLVDPVLRLDGVGDLYFNTTFGTGSPSYVKLLNSNLKSFELADVKTSTSVVQLLKGTTNTGIIDLYNTSISSGCKVTIIAHNITNNNKEFIEFGVVDSGADVYFTEYGNITTNTPILNTSFTITGSNNTRITLQLTDQVVNNHNVKVTAHITATKK